jgi:hypothetical protein
MGYCKGDRGIKCDGTIEMMMTMMMMNEEIG